MAVQRLGGHGPSSMALMTAASAAGVIDSDSSSVTMVSAFRKSSLGASAAA